MNCWAVWPFPLWYPLIFLLLTARLGRLLPTDRLLHHILPSFLPDSFSYLLTVDRASRATRSNFSLSIHNAPDCCYKLRALFCSPPWLFAPHFQCYVFKIIKGLNPDYGPVDMDPGPLEFLYFTALP